MCVPGFPRACLVCNLTYPLRDMDEAWSTPWEFSGSDDELPEWCMGYSQVGQEVMTTEALWWWIVVYIRVVNEWLEWRGIA